MPENIPPEIKEILDRAAGKTHSMMGPVMSCLSEILAKHREMIESENSDVDA